MADSIDEVAASGHAEQRRETRFYVAFDRGLFPGQRLVVFGPDRDPPYDFVDVKAIGRSSDGAFFDHHDSSV